MGEVPEQVCGACGAAGAGGDLTCASCGAVQSAQDPLIGTRLADEYTIVDRISGDAPPDYFIGPSWCLDKPAVKAAVLAEFTRRGTYQGAALQIQNLA